MISRTAAVDQKRQNNISVTEANANKMYTRHTASSCYRVVDTLYTPFPEKDQAYNLP